MSVSSPPRKGRTPAPGERPGGRKHAARITSEDSKTISFCRNRNAQRYRPSIGPALCQGAALKKQNLTIKAADAVIINTGWGKLYGKDNARFVKSCPGIGVKAAEWLMAQSPVLLGSDNWPVEVAPNPDPALSLPVHQIALVVNGVHLLENLKLDELLAKNVQEFAFIMTPLKIRGGTGSTVSTIAVH